MMIIRIKWNDVNEVQNFVNTKRDLWEIFLRCKCELLRDIHIAQFTHSYISKSQYRFDFFFLSIFRCSFANFNLYRTKITVWMCN